MPLLPCFRLIEGSGATSIYDKMLQEQNYTLEFSSDPKLNFGYTNAGRGFLSAHTNLHNNHIFAFNKYKNMDLMTGSGEIKSYIYSKYLSKRFKGPIYKISSIEAPNRSKTLFEFHKKGFLKKVTSKNEYQDVIFGELKYSQDENFHWVQIEASDERKVSYYLKSAANEKEIIYYLIDCIIPGQLPVSYDYTSHQDRFMEK